jgi:CRP-like cAMP-binding protein
MKALFIARLTFIEVVETNPRLAMEMNRFIEERAKLVRRALGVTENGAQRTSMRANGLLH